jgi:hypothetical protein
LVIKEVPVEVWHEEVAELEFGGDFKDKLSFLLTPGVWD